MMSPLRLEILDGKYAVVGLSPLEAIPEWLTTQGGFVSITRTDSELSIICCEDDVPSSVQCARGFRVLRVMDKLDFSMCGVLFSLLDPLARSAVSILAVSTNATDYVLIPSSQLGFSIRILSEAGHRVV